MDWTLAIAHYNEILQLDPLNNAFNITIWYEQAVTMAKFKMCDEALKALDKALKLDKDYIQAHFKKGDILLQMKKYEEAIQQFTKVKQMNPGVPGLREKVHEC